MFFRGHDRRLFGRVWFGIKLTLQIVFFCSKRFSSQFHLSFVSSRFIFMLFLFHGISSWGLPLISDWRRDIRGDGIKVTLRIVRNLLKMSFESETEFGFLLKFWIHQTFFFFNSYLHKMLQEVFILLGSCWCLDQKKSSNATVTCFTSPCLMFLEEPKQTSDFTQTSG